MRRSSLCSQFCRVGIVASLFLQVTVSLHAGDRTPGGAVLGGEVAVTALLPASHEDAIDQALQPFLDSHQAAGFVTLVAKDGKIVHESAIGRASLEDDQPMATDSMFWIASMTKPMSATALLILEEEGKLSVDDPVARFIPEFEHLKLADGTPVREILRIRHLLTHSSGLQDPPKIEGPETRSLEEQCRLMAAQPLGFEPGTKWSYSSSLQVVGRIVEIASGRAFDEFLEERIFTPLKMEDATFTLSDAQVKRLATTYKLNEDKTGLERFERRLSTESGTKRTPNPSGGLFATVGNMHRFYQMLLNDGELDGVRILKPETVQRMTSRQSGDLETGFTPGNCWGFGVCIVREPQGVTEALSPGSFGHGGAHGTQVWCDPKLKAVYVLMVQRSDLPNSDASDFRRTLQAEGRKMITSP